jgi:TetR/AcrR family transcriptional repressor of nem operon
MAKINVRERLLDAGLETLHRCGFNGCGVQEIAETAGVPKGSFYNHFESKEALGAAVLERYWEQRGGSMLRLLEVPVSALASAFAITSLCWPPIWPTVGIPAVA